jgi:hypothetical protein
MSIRELGLGFSSVSDVQFASDPLGYTKKKYRRCLPWKEK